MELGLISEAGDKLRVQRTRELGLIGASSQEVAEWLSSDDGPPNEIIEQICSASIIRDELIPKMSIDQTEMERFHFVSAAVGSSRAARDAKKAGQIIAAAKALENTAKGEYDRLRGRVNELLEQLTRLRDLASRATDIGSAHRIIQEHLSLPSDTPEELERVRAAVASRRIDLTNLRTLISDIEDARELFQEADHRRGASLVDDLEKQKAQVSSRIKAADRNLRSLKVRTDAGGASAAGLKMLSALLQLTEHVDTIDGHCPVCDTLLTEPEFRQGVNLARRRVSEKNRAAAEFATKESNLEREIARWQSELTNIEAKLRDQLSEATSLKNREADLLARSSSIGIRISQLSEAGALISRSETVAASLVLIERALQIIELSRSTSAIATIESDLSSARDQAAEAEGAYARAEKVVQTARDIDHSVQRAGNEISEERLAMISPLLSDLYQRLRPHIDLRNIEYRLRGDIRRFLRLSVGEDLNPQFMFSSGQRRAAGLAFLLSVYLSSSRSILRSLMLDDPVQHIDDYRALNLVEVLGALRRSDRQIVCAVEDEALAALLTRRLRSSFESPGMWHRLKVGTDGTPIIASSTAVKPLPERALAYAEDSLGMM